MCINHLIVREASNPRSSGKRAAMRFHERSGFGDHTTRPILRNGRHNQNDCEAFVSVGGARSDASWDPSKRLP
jgi:hypothetical protein